MMEAAQHELSAVVEILVNLTSEYISDPLGAELLAPSGLN
jgi:hypothetical protein